MQILVLLPFAMLIAVGRSQIPSFGGCPEHPAIKDFEPEKFIGKWYEIERYFTVSELASKCITATYEKRPDGKVYINNAYTNRFTGVQRIISGVMKLTGKTQNEGLYNVQYPAIPVSYDTTLKVLDTDYETFAVVWSCNSVGPFGHTESVWAMGREREPPGPVLQRIYGVFDRFKINRTFFVQSDQRGCETLPPPVEAIDPTPAPTKTTSTTNKKKTDEKIKIEIIPNVPTVKTSEPIAVQSEENIIPVNALKTETVQTVEIVDTPTVQLKSQPIEEFSLPARIIESESETDVSKIDTFVPTTKFVKTDENDAIKKESIPSTVGALKSGIDRDTISADVAKKPDEVEPTIEIENAPKKEVIESVESSVSVETKKPLVTKKLISTRRVSEKTETIHNIPVAIVSS